MKEWNSIFFNVRKTFYLFDICNFKDVNKSYFLIVFQNLNLENLSFLSLISQMYPFIKIKKADNLISNSDLETQFQVNSATSTADLASSSLCFLIGTDTRYEGSALNLTLRQRYFKGNVKFISIGSLLNLTFPVSFLGSNVSVLKFIVEGNHPICQDIVNASNPILVTNSEVLKNKNLQSLFNNFKILKHANILNKIWNGYNVLNSSLYNSSLQNFGQFSSLTLKDLISFNSLYLINVNLNNLSNFKKILESKLIHAKPLIKLESKKLLLNQNSNSEFLKSVPSKVLYLPNNLFFDTSETFINTEGLLKRTRKLVSKKSVKSDWQLLRKFTQTLNVNNSLNFSGIISYTNNNLFDYKNFVGFQFYASKTLTNVNFQLVDKTQKFSIVKKYDKFKFSTIKLFDTKLKYWLDDFYIGGKDKFCQNSLTLSRCSMNYKRQVTNFF
jgi:hypothetical protein